MISSDDSRAFPDAPISDTKATSTQITGKAFAANYAAPTPSTLTTAIADANTAFANAAGRILPDFLNLGSGAIGGMTLTRGLYKWTTGVSVSTDVTISGAPTDIFIFQISGAITIAAAHKVILTGGVLAQNIFWQTSGGATFAAGSHFEGILLSATAVTLETGTSMNGRIFSKTAVALQKATVVQP